MRVNATCELIGRCGDEAVRRGFPPFVASAFTLVELLVAVIVLVAVLAAAGRIFSATEAVAGRGEAAADMLEDAVAIERCLRDDFAHLSTDGFLAIRCVAVPNDVRGGAALLNPDLPRSAVIRADQIVYFVDGLQSSRVFRIGAGANHKGQGVAARVYFGHAFQLAGAGAPADRAAGVVRALDPVEPVLPWTAGPVAVARTRFEGAADGADVFSIEDPSTARVEPVDARRWLLVRQSVMLVDDETAPRASNRKTVYLDQVLAGRSIFLHDPELGPTPQVLAGRVDAAATQLDDLRRLLAYGRAGPRPWHERGPGDGRDQRSLIARELVYYPRAERAAPGPHRVDHALTAHVIAAACSSVVIDWAYDDGAGAAWAPPARPARGVRVGGGAPAPWFGLRDPQRGVTPYGAERPRRWARADAIFAENIEGEADDDEGGADERGSSPRTYEAIFGFNRDRALGADGAPDRDLAFTPWPSRIRVTLTLHDPALTIEGGRVYQFVLELPRRAAARET